MLLEDSQDDDDDVNKKFKGSSSSQVEGTPTDKGHDTEHSGRIIANTVYI